MMNSCNGLILGAVVLGLVCSSASSETNEPKELVSSPDFRSSEPGAMPEGWSAWHPRWEAAKCDIRPQSEGLLIEAQENPYAVGGVYQEIKGVEGGKAYAIKAVCHLQSISTPHRSVIVRINWTNDGKNLHPAGMLIRGPVINDDIAAFEDVLVAPDDANGVRLSLEVKWPQGGSVLWQNTSIKQAPTPTPRKVRVGTVYLRPSQSTPENNLKLFCEQIDEAGKLGLDIVCLGEAITSVGTSAKPEEYANPIPGSDTEMLGAAAARSKIWVVAGIAELDGDTLYNTAVLLDRDGKVAGKYRKIHLPREEWKQGITPGEEYPVFQTDFGKIAIQICYDWFFPEPEAIFALQGAEMIFAPTWGNTLPDKDGRVDGESTFRVRARDNGVYMIPSVYDGNSLVIDPMGKILASSDGKTGVFWAEVDLNTRERLGWVGYWRSIGSRDRMPHTYNMLMRDPQKPMY